MAVKMRLHIARLAGELEFIRGRISQYRVRPITLLLGGKSGIGDAGEMLAHEVGELALEFLRRRRPVAKLFHANNDSERSLLFSLGCRNTVSETQDVMLKPSLVGRGAPRAPG